MIWPPASWTGIGSMPGTDAFEAARIVAGEAPEFPHVVELPARGPGADMIGRTAALLARASDGLGVETTPDGWRLTPGIGRTVRRAWSWLGEDLDALEAAAGLTKAPIKVQITGPWTLAAQIELSSGERALRDPGACRDLAEALAQAASDLAADVRRRFPKSAGAVLQIDEPMLPAVLAGRVGTASGLSSYRAVEPAIASAALRGVCSADAVVGIHCCAVDPPIALMRAAGAQFISIDLLRAKGVDEPLAEAWEAGTGLLLGSVPSRGTAMTPGMTAREASRPIRELAERVGLADPANLSAIAVTPTCGLAGATPARARAAYEACHAASSVLRDVREEGSGGDG